MASSSAQGSYEHEFIDAVRDDLVCQICQLPARDPQQTTCCGKVYCKSCINRLQSNRCPNCRNSLIDRNGNKHYFPDKASDRRIKELKVKCDNHKNGCKWKQELAQLEQHLSKCGYTKIECKNNCKKSVLRDNLRKHLQHECLMREYQCLKCKEKGKYQTITTDHLEVCPEQDITCPNPGCGVRYKRKETYKHQLGCQREVIKCNYSKVGCTFQCLREDMHKHISLSTEHHLKLAMNTVAIAIGSTKCNPIIKMKDFQMHRTTKEIWFSTPFYSHPGGYKMYLRVDANGCEDGEGTHVSVFLYMMRGENDDNLVWPFKGEVTLILLNQLKNNKHYEHKIAYTTDERKDYNSRVTDGEQGGNGYGRPQFISHEELGHRAYTNCQYLKDDSLYFRVSVEVHEACKPWLTPTT